MHSIIQEDYSTSGTHALVIGISHYPYIAGGNATTELGQRFDLGQLTSAARSASLFAEWLMKEFNNPEKPLKSLRVLLSPSPDEEIAPGVNRALNALPKNHYSATRTNVEACAEAISGISKQNRENQIIVYVAGHGVQLSLQGATLLLEDFASPKSNHGKSLFGAIDVANFHAFMNTSNDAKTQFWFVDTCRQKPDIAAQFIEMKGALEYDIPLSRTECSPIFMATAPRQSAYAYVNGESLFNTALLWTLKNAATTGPLVKNRAWYVSFGVLLTFLIDKVKELANAEEVNQTVTVDGAIKDSLFHVFNTPPKVDLNIQLSPLILVKPPATLTYKGKTVIFQNNTNWPFSLIVDAGIYTLELHPDGDFQGGIDQFPVSPPSETIVTEASS